jgi:membrane protein
MARTISEDDRARGRTASRPGGIPGRGWRDILWRVWAKIFSDRAMLVAGGVTFYLLLALFPALAAFVSLFGLFADPATITEQADMLNDVLPDSGAAIVIDQLTELAGQETSALGFGLAVSLALALWTANNGVKAIFEALNIAYEEQERRSLLRLHLVSFSFTLGGMVLTALLLAAIGLVPAVLALAELDRGTETILRVLRWLLILPIVAAVLALFYRFGPSRRPARWRWVTWGSALAAAVWLATSIGFSWYLENFANYNATYGSLGALVGLMLWMWLSSLILIVGAELNAEMEHQTRCDTTEPPERPMGERGAFVADTLGRAVE